MPIPRFFPIFRPSSPEEKRQQIYEIVHWNGERREYIQVSGKNPEEYYENMLRQKVKGKKQVI
jgi:P pilus assembly chaperone PapD